MGMRWLDCKERVFERVKCQARGGVEEPTPSMRNRVLCAELRVTPVPVVAWLQGCFLQQGSDRGYKESQ